MTSHHFKTAVSKPIRRTGRGLVKQILTSSMNCFLSPVNLVAGGPSSCLLASTLSSFSEDKHLENTASPEKKTVVYEEYEKRFVYIWDKAKSLPDVCIENPI